jgi:ABC-type transport system involved in cytochrome c biogenesis permease component
MKNPFWFKAFSFAYFLYAVINLAFQKPAPALMPMRYFPVLIPVIIFGFRRSSYETIKVFMTKAYVSILFFSFMGIIGYLAPFHLLPTADGIVLRMILILFCVGKLNSDFFEPVPAQAATRRLMS